MAKHYYYDGGRLIAEKWSTGAYLLYHYDENSSIYAITYSSTGSGYAKYYLLRNLQGDVVQILDSENNVIGNYSYDAWGNLLSVYYENGNEITSTSSFALINPIRYRGYYYDSETGFYYLKSQYYDPANCRFISADSQMDLGNGTTNLNLFAYCGNDPVNRADPSGAFFEEIWDSITDFGNTIASGVKKLAKAIGGSFQVEGGLGYGVGASAKLFNMKTSFAAYHDPLTVGFKDGKSYTGMKGSAGTSFQIIPGSNWGFSTEYEHRFETGGVRDWDEHETFSPPWDVYNCPKTVKDPLQISLPFFEPVETELSQGFFVGIGLDAHVGVGGHFSIGWDLSKFWQLLTE